MPFLTIDFRIHWRHISPYKSSTWTVERQKVCRDLVELNGYEKC